MNDTTAFERLIADVADESMGPSRPVDAALIVQSAKTMAPPGRRAGLLAWLHGGRPNLPEGGFSMFSAVKFVVAAAIVALFGGFLLAGILTTPQDGEVLPAAVSASPTAEAEPEVATRSPDPEPSPTSTAESLTGMVTEEVEPGLLRVVNDGVRDLASVDNRDIVAGYDDGIWLLREDEFLRLGDDGSHGWPTVLGREGRDFEVGPHGTVWTIPDPLYQAQPTGSDIYRSHDGEEWTVQPCPDDCMGVTVAPDGRAWVSSTDAVGRWRVGLLTSGGRWQPLDGDIPNDWSPGGFAHLFITDAGDLYGVGYGWMFSLYRYEDGTWHRTNDFYSAVDVGPDGTVWGTEGDRWEDGLARFADGEWARWTHDELPEMAWSRGGGMGFGIGFDDEFEAAPDGSLWAHLWRSGDDVDAAGGDPAVRDWEQRSGDVASGRAACDGVVRFDGETVDHFLPGRCISMDIAADGSVWVLADEEEGGVLYVITPEAVAATE